MNPLMQPSRDHLHATSGMLDQGCSIHCFPLDPIPPTMFCLSCKSVWHEACLHRRGFDVQKRTVNHIPHCPRCKDVPDVLSHMMLLSRPTQHHQSFNTPVVRCVSGSSVSSDSTSIKSLTSSGQQGLNVSPGGSGGSNGVSGMGPNISSHINGGSPSPVSHSMLKNGGIVWHPQNAHHSPAISSPPLSTSNSGYVYSMSATAPCNVDVKVPHLPQIHHVGNNDKSNYSSGKPSHQSLAQHQAAMLSSTTQMNHTNGPHNDMSSTAAAAASSSTSSSSYPHSIHSYETAVNGACLSLIPVNSADKSTPEAHVAPTLSVSLPKHFQLLTLLKANDLFRVVLQNGYCVYILSRDQVRYAQVAAATHSSGQSYYQLCDPNVCTHVVFLLPNFVPATLPSASNGTIPPPPPPLPIGNPKAMIKVFVSGLHPQEYAQIMQKLRNSSCCAPQMKQIASHPYASHVPHPHNAIPTSSSSSNPHLGIEILHKSSASTAHNSRSLSSQNRDSSHYTTSEGPPPKNARVDSSSSISSTPPLPQSSPSSHSHPVITSSHPIIATTVGNSFNAASNPAVGISQHPSTSMNQILPSSTQPPYNYTPSSAERDTFYSLQPPLQNSTSNGNHNNTLQVNTALNQQPPSQQDSSLPSSPSSLILISEEQRQPQSSSNNTLSTAQPQRRNVVPTHRHVRLQVDLLSSNLSNKLASSALFTPYCLCVPALDQILKHLEINDRLACRLVCTAWQRMVDTSTAWRQVFINTCHIGAGRRFNPSKASTYLSKCQRLKLYWECNTKVGGFDMEELRDLLACLGKDMEQLDIHFYWSREPGGTDSIDLHEDSNEPSPSSLCIPHDVIPSSLPRLKRLNIFGFTGTNVPKLVWEVQSGSSISDSVTEMVLDNVQHFPSILQISHEELPALRNLVLRSFHLLKEVSVFGFNNIEKLTLDCRNSHLTTSSFEWIKELTKLLSVRIENVMYSVHLLSFIKMLASSETLKNFSLTESVPKKYLHTNELIANELPTGLFQFSWVCNIISDNVLVDGAYSLMGDVTRTEPSSGFLSAQLCGDERFLRYIIMKRMTREDVDLSITVNDKSEQISL